jgi:hypothetical protein
MKIIKDTIKYTLLGIMAVAAISCKKDFIEVNTDPLGKETVEADQLLAPTLVDIMTTNMLRNRNFNNELMQVTVDINDSEGKVFRYDIRRNWADYTWNNWHIALTNIKDVYRFAAEGENPNTSYQGISLILQSWIHSLLTDTYGDVPYTEANQGRDGVYQPVFDKQKDIYLDMFEKLEQANELLKTEMPIVVTSDPIYNGDIAKWRRFGNSLYLRLLLRVSGKSEVASTVTAKIKEIIDNNPQNYPIIENNSQTANLLWTGSNNSAALYTSPFMARVRANDFYNLPIGDFFLGRLVTWENPLVDPALGTSNVPRLGIARGADGYVGVPSGYAPGGAVIRQAYFYADGAAVTLQTDKYTGIILNAAEVSFIKAEAAAKGWISGSAADYYYEGMADVINYWMPDYISSPTDPNFIDYVATANLTWDPTLPLEDAAFGANSQMEMIHVQKYYAMFLMDFQQWFEHRRTGHPVLPKGTGLVNGGKMPSRLYYPVITQSANPTNYQNAVASQGADDINTMVWWQKP